MVCTHECVQVSADTLGYNRQYGVQVKKLRRQRYTYVTPYAVCHVTTYAVCHHPRAFSARAYTIHRECARVCARASEHARPERQFRRTMNLQQGVQGKGVSPSHSLSLPCPCICANACVGFQAGLCAEDGNKRTKEQVDLRNGNAGILMHAAYLAQPARMEL